jgi:hypothetical protein
LLSEVRSPIVDVDLDGDGDVDLDEPTLTIASARGEAMECAASVDVMKLRNVVAPGRNDHGIRLLEGVVAMLTKMI